MKLRKVLVAIMVGVMMVSVAGCGAKRTNEVDEHKTTLYVGNFAGGIGDEWLKSAISKFEEKYADTSFENGKKGVQVLIGDNNNTTMIGTELEKIIATSQNEVFFTESVYYYDWVEKGFLHDITNAVTTPLSEFDEEKSITDKMESYVSEAMTVDGKVYALPFWEGYYGFVYNATLFDEKGWYFAEDGSFTNADGKLGAGPDGQTGTYDDGMPATYADFFKLLEKISKDNVTPIQWAGASPDYFTWLIGALFADYEGYDDLMINYTFEGETELVKLDTVDTENLTYEKETVRITAENGYELARQEGYVYALDFAQDLLQGNGYYDVNSSLSGSYKQQDAQLAFVRNATTTNNKPVAILIDGSWWENEATTAFRETYGSNATKYDNEMEMKWMPLPKATADLVGAGNIMVSPLDSYCFINANIEEEKVEVAEKFLQFVHTDVMMAEFTEMTGVVKPYEYETDTTKLTPFAASVVEASANSKVVFPKSNNELYRFGAINFRLANLLGSVYDSSQTHTTSITLPLTSKTGTSYKYDMMDYYKGMLNYRRDVIWSTFNSVLK